MDKFNKDLKDYYLETKKILNCSKGLKTKFINDLLDNINIYIQENPDSTIDDIKIKFGTPEELSDSFFYTLDNKDIEEYRKKYKVLRKIGIVSILAILISIVGIYIFNYVYVKNSTVIYYDDIIIESEE